MSDEIVREFTRELTLKEHLAAQRYAQERNLAGGNGPCTTVIDYKAMAAEIARLRDALARAKGE